MLRAMLHAIDHVVIRVRDLEAAAQDYARLLGRAPSWRGVHPGAGTANALFRLENGYVELLSPASEGPLARALSDQLANHGEGVAALALATDDAGALAARLRELGIEASAPAEGEGREATSGALRRWRSTFLPAAATRGPLVFAIEHLSPADALPLRAATQPVEATIHALDHVVLASEDLEAARRLYGDALGLRLALDRRFESRGLRILFFQLGGTTLEVAGPLEPPARAASGDRFGGLAYRVADVAAAHARLASSGVDVSPTRPGFKPGTLVCSVRGGTCSVPTLLIGPAGPAVDAPATDTADQR
jgi:catechol 2,3-dioxygenase-like lactoylglutathione lyase family enzyme